MTRTKTFLGYTYLTIVVTFVIFILFYGVYIKTSPLNNYTQIKTIIENSAYFSAADRNLIGNFTITDSLVDKVVVYFIPNLIQNLITSLIIGSFIIIVFYIMNKGPKGNVAEGAKAKDIVINMSDKKIDYFKDFNNMIITIDGILISIIGGFTVASGSKNLLIINGFEILIISVVYSFLAHTSLTSGLPISQNQIYKSSFLRFSSRSNFSFWYFILGMSLIVGGFVLNVL